MSEQDGRTFIPSGPVSVIRSAARSLSAQGAADNAKDVIDLRDQQDRYIDEVCSRIGGDVISTRR